MITLKQIFLSFNSRKLLDGINLTIETGQTVVLFGPSGTGKTVLMKIILGLIRPDSGEITIDDQRIDKMNERELTQFRLKTGTLFQYYALFDSMSVLENVGFYLKNHSALSHDEVSKKVSAELHRVSMEGSENLKPAELSGGMQKRVGIARAIVHRPGILLYDSPTDGLDPVTSDRIIELIKEINTRSRVTSLVISNDMNTAFRLGNQMAMLLHGKIHFLGTPEELAKSRDPYVYQFIRGLETGPLTRENSKH